MYNAEIFRKHGLTEEEDPQTCDVFTEILQVLKNRNEKPKISGLRGASGQTEHIFAPFVRAAVGRKGVEDAISEDGRATDAPDVEATHRMVDLATEGYLDPDRQELDYTGALGRPSESKNPTWTEGVWGLGIIGQELGSPDNFGIMAVPPWDASIPLR